MAKKYLAKIIATDNEGLRMISACTTGANVKVAIGQPIGISDNVQFDSVTLTSGDSLNVGGFVISDGTISGSRVRFQQDLEVTQNLRVTSSLVVNGTITSGSGTFGSTSKTTTHNTGSTRWGESLTQKQFATGSFEISSSFFLNGYEINEISNEYKLKLYYNDTCLSFIYSRQPCNKLSLFNPNALGKMHSPASRPSILPLPVKYSLLIKP